MLLSTGITNAWYGRRTRALLQPCLSSTRDHPTHRGELVCTYKNSDNRGSFPGVGYCDVSPSLQSTRHPSYENTITWLYNITAQ